LHVSFIGLFNNKTEADWCNLETVGGLHKRYLKVNS